MPTVDLSGLALPPELAAMRGVWLPIAFVFGLCVGSFVNVLIHRLPRRMSIVRPRSSCPSCLAPIAWYDNVPVVSFVVLRGRCRRCRAPIAWRYPAVEMLTGALFTLVAARFGPSLGAAIYMGFAAALVAVTFIDLDHRIIPDRITLAGAVAGLALAPVTGRGWLGAAAGAVAGGGLLFLLAVLYERIRGVAGMGGGDVKFAAMLGAFLGLKGILLTLFLASLAGSLVGVLVIALRGGGGKTALPFGTFLAPAAAVALLAGDALIGLYLHLFIP